MQHRLRRNRSHFSEKWLLEKSDGCLSQYFYILLARLSFCKYESRFIAKPRAECDTWAICVSCQCIFAHYMACETLGIVQHAVVLSYLIFRHFNKDHRNQKRRKKTCVSRLDKSSWHDCLTLIHILQDDDLEIQHEDLYKVLSFSSFCYLLFLISRHTLTVFLSLNSSLPNYFFT